MNGLLDRTRNRLPPPQWIPVTHPRLNRVGCSPTLWAVCLVTEAIPPASTITCRTKEGPQSKRDIEAVKMEELASDWACRGISAGR